MVRDLVVAIANTWMPYDLVLARYYVAAVEEEVVEEEAVTGVP
jgi:hypothetical protein